MKRYTNTPVVETYNQIGKVIRAIFLCLAKSAVKPLYVESKIKGKISAANGIWVIRIK